MRRTSGVLPGGIVAFTSHGAARAQDTGVRAEPAFAENPRHIVPASATAHRPMHRTAVTLGGIAIQR
ncbi:MAG: hypothetical protein ACREMP_06130 [Candidatus Tyrphobacter sp.]